MPFDPSSKPVGAMTGVLAATPPNMTIEKRDPTANDTNTTAARPGWFWLNNAARPTRLWYFSRIQDGAAIYVLVGAGAGDLNTLTGNTGGAVSPDGFGNIDIVGDGVTLTVAGNAGTNTLTIGFAGGFSPAGSFQTDDGADAVPLAGVLEITGFDPATSNIETSSPGTGNQVFVAVTPTINVQEDINLNNTTADGLIGVINWGGSTFIHQRGTLNTFVGQMAGNLALTTGTAVENSTLGNNTGIALTSGHNNLFAGSYAGASATSASFNVFAGADAGTTATTSFDCTFIGNTAASSLITGNNSIAIGSGSGNNWIAAESNNIAIGSPGLLGESNSLRLGVSGAGAFQVNKCHIGGIYANLTALNADNGVAIVDLNDNVKMTRGNNGQLLIGATGTGPSWANMTSMGGTVVITNNAGAINLESTGGAAGTVQFDTDAGSANPLAGVIQILGGTNINTSGASDTVLVNLDDDVALAGFLEVGTTLTVNSMGFGSLVSNATGDITSINGTTGQVLTAQTGAAPIWAANASGGITWEVRVASLNPMLVNHGYIANGAGVLTFTLPTVSAVGDILEVTAMAATGWIIAQNANQSIQFTTAATTIGVGGSLASTNIGDSVRMVCNVANLNWIVISSTGNAITIV